MVYYDAPGSTRRIRRPLIRRPLANLPTVDDETRARITDEAARHPGFTAPELAAVLSHYGTPIDVLTVRAVLEA